MLWMQIEAGGLECVCAHKSVYIQAGGQPQEVGKCRLLMKYLPE